MIEVLVHPVVLIPNAFPTHHVTFVFVQTISQPTVTRLGTQILRSHLPTLTPEMSGEHGHASLFSGSCACADEAVSEQWEPVGVPLDVPPVEDEKLSSCGCFVATLLEEEEVFTFLVLEVDVRHVGVGEVVDETTGVEVVLVVVDCVKAVYTPATFLSRVLVLGHGVHAWKVLLTFNTLSNTLRTCQVSHLVLFQPVTFTRLPLALPVVTALTRNKDGRPTEEEEEEEEEDRV